jgi:flagella basal body P-ring formation protein FlgA
MKARISLILILSTFILIPDILAGKIEINLMGNVILEEKTITFRDIATVTGDDVKLVNRINDIEVGKTPWANSVRSINKDFMKIRLNASNVNVSDVNFTNANSVTVSVESTKITGLEISQKAKEYLLNVLPVTGREATVELTRMPGNQWIPSRRDKINLDVSLVDASKDRGKIELIVSAYSNGTRYFKIPVRFNVRVFEYVAITKRKIARNQQLTKENVFMARRETTKIRGLAFSSRDNLRGKTAVVSILPYTILTEDMVEMPPTIKQGSVIKLFITSSGFRIVTKGLAQQTGYTGETIKVKNLDSKKILYGEIIDSGRVQITF